MSDQIRCPDCNRYMCNLSGDWTSVSMTCPRCRALKTVERKVLVAA